MEGQDCRDQGTKNEMTHCTEMQFLKILQTENKYVEY